MGVSRGPHLMVIWSYFPLYLCKLGGVIEFFLKEKDTVDGLLVLLFVLAISPEFLG